MLSSPRIGISETVYLVVAVPLAGIVTFVAEMEYPLDAYAQAANNAKQKTDDRRIEKERPEDFIASSFR
jgi:hypothetical protein